MLEAAVVAAAVGYASAAVYLYARTARRNAERAALQEKRDGAAAPAAVVGVPMWKDTRASAAAPTSESAHDA